MSYKIVGKYIKNLKFTIADPKDFFLLTKNISNYKIKIDIKSKSFKEKIYLTVIMTFLTKKLVDFFLMIFVDEQTF